MKNTIKPGQTLTARSVCDSECVFKAEILSRKGKFVVVKNEIEREPRRVMVREDQDGNEYIMALGSYSMAPMFRAIADAPEKVAELKQAEKLGGNAFRVGKQCVPALDAELKVLIAKNNGPIGGSSFHHVMALMTAWTQSWTRANLAEQSRAFCFPSIIGVCNLTKNERSGIMGAVCDSGKNGGSAGGSI